MRRGASARPDAAWPQGDWHDDREVQKLLKRRHGACATAVLIGRGVNVAVLIAADQSSSMTGTVGNLEGRLKRRSVHSFGSRVIKTATGYLTQPHRATNAAHDVAFLARHRSKRETLTRILSRGGGHGPRRNLFATSAPRVLSVLRIVVGALYLQYGTAKFLHVPHVASLDDVQLMSLVGWAGCLNSLADFCC